MRTSHAVTSWPACPSRLSQLADHAAMIPTHARVLRRLGFQLFDVVELHWEANTKRTSSDKLGLIQADLLFVQKASALWRVHAKRQGMRHGTTSTADLLTPRFVIS